MTAVLNPSTSTDWLTVCIAEWQGIELITDSTQVGKLSQDWHHFSPILSGQLADKRAHIVARPVDEAQVIRIARTCAQKRIPITLRGGGTGNYGQAVPLYGGVVLDLSRMQRIVWVKPGLARVEAGVRLTALDKEARKLHWELRMFPSTAATSTYGGFLGGGFGGVGSVNYGILKETGNVYAVRVVTLEEEPRVLELRGSDVRQVTHSWGISGIITELEISLARAQPWAEGIIAFSNVMDSVRFGFDLANAPGIPTRLVSQHAWPIPSYFTALRDHLPSGSHCVLAIFIEPGYEALQALAKEHGGTLCWVKAAADAGKGTTLTDYCFNHTTLHARAADPGLTYIQSRFPADQTESLRLIEQMIEHFGEEVVMHIEFQRVGGRVIAGGGQVVHYSTPERLQEIMAFHEQQGVTIPNPHTYILEEAGKKVVDPKQVLFNQQVDPYGLLNPGKTLSRPVSNGISCS
jgi:FAD/FMN-containing dehydrogenase